MRALHLLQKLMGRADGADIFQEFDTDGDGQISRDELRAGFSKIGQELSETDVDAIMALADTDGDGTIDTNEFVQMGKMTKEVEAMSRSMVAGLDALSVRLDGEMVDMSASLSSTVSSLGARLDADVQGVSLQLTERLEEQVACDANEIKNLKIAAQMRRSEMDAAGGAPAKGKKGKEVVAAPAPPAAPVRMPTGNMSYDIAAAMLEEENAAKAARAAPAPPKKKKGLFG